MPLAFLLTFTNPRCSSTDKDVDDGDADDVVVVGAVDDNDEADAAGGGDK